MKNNMISRRGFLRKAVGTAAAATVAGMAAGCSAGTRQLFGGCTRHLHSRHLLCHRKRHEHGHGHHDL